MKPQFDPQSQMFNTSQRRRILAASISANLFANVSMSGLNVALPVIEKALDLSAVVMVWVASSLLLATAASIAPVARLADVWGRRQTTILGLTIIITASAACGLATGAAGLLSGRVLMGLGMAMVMAATMAMAAAVYPPDRRGMVFGYIVSAVYIGLAAGPGLCGLLVELLGWPSVFWLTSLSLILPLALLLSVGSKVPRSNNCNKPWLRCSDFSRQQSGKKPERLARTCHSYCCAGPKVDKAPAEAAGRHYDYLGAGLWMLSLSLIFIGLPNLLRPSGPVLVLGGLLVGLAFVRRQLAVDRPLMDVRLFADSRRFRWASLAAFTAYCSAMGAIFLMGLYLQYIKGFSPKEAGFFLMVQPLVQALLTPLTGRLSDSRDPGRIAAVGLAITTIAVLMIALGLSKDTSLVYILVALVVFGVGFAAFAAPNSNAVMSSVTTDKLGVASGVITATRLVGQISSLSFTALVFSLMIGVGRMGPELFPDFIRAARFCFLVFAPMCFLGAIVSLIGDQGRGGTRNHLIREPQVMES